MKILIIRMYPDVINIKKYNCQELGLAKALIKKGHQCDIVLYTDQKESFEENINFEKKNIHIYHLKAKSFLKNAFFEKKLYEIALNYDVVQTTEYDQIANLKLKKILNEKLIIYHGPYKSKFTKKYKIKCVISDFVYLFNKKFKKTLILTKSELATDFINKKGFSNVKTIGVGFDETRVNIKNEVKNEFISNLEKIKKENDYRYLLYIGKIEKRRNIKFLLNLINNIEDEKTKLVIVGKGNENYFRNCYRYAKKLNICEKIYYKESLTQNEIAEIYRISDLFLLPTRYEIFGMVLLESMYFALPTITTLNGGASILIDNGKDGYIMDKGFKINDWKETIINLLNNNNLLYKIGNKAKEKIINNYTWDKLVNKFIEQYIKCNTKVKR